MFSADLLARAENLLATARSAGVRIATAESCTGGLIAALLTEIADFEKMNGIRDLIACSQFLVDHKYTSTAKLGRPIESIGNADAGSVMSRIVRR